MVGKIEFLENTARKTQGLSGSNIEHFRDNPYRSCARETGQNSNDARPKDNQGHGDSETIRIEYNLLDIKGSDVPFASDLLAVMRSCLEQSRARCEQRDKNPSKDKEVRFFERAVQTLQNDSIKVLEIADYNTTGLTGPFDDAYSVFNSLVKADGDNNKLNADSGGSFGIGKNAAFAVSDLQTVIYSTLTGDHGDQFGCQGRLQLISHEHMGRKNAAEGYWGLENFYAIEDPTGLPEWIVRKERGASIFVVGFRWNEHWAELMLLSVLTNFLIAIMRGRMEFGIDSGRYPVNRSTLTTYLNDSRIEEVAEQSGLSEALNRTRDLHACLTAGTSVETDLNTGGAKGARLRILVSDDLKTPRSVLFIRNGMFISDNLGEFGYPLNRFPGTRPFIAVVEPSDNEAGRNFSELLKRMENPEHNNFSPERIRDDKEREEIKKLIKRLHKDIRAGISEAAKVTESDATSLDELARYFSGDPDQDNSSQSNEPDPERYTYGKAKRKKNPDPKPSLGSGTSGGAGGHGGGGGSDSGGTGESEGSGSEGKGKSGPAKRLPITAKRCRREPASAAFSHRIFFTPSSPGKHLSDCRLLV